MNKKIRLLYVKVKKYVIFSKILDHRRRTTDKMTIKIGRDHYWIILHPLWTGEVVKLSRSYRISNIWSYLDMNVFRKIKFDTGSTLAKNTAPIFAIYSEDLLWKSPQGHQVGGLYPFIPPTYSWLPPWRSKTVKIGCFDHFLDCF